MSKWKTAGSIASGAFLVSAIAFTGYVVVHTYVHNTPVSSETFMANCTKGGQADASKERRCLEALRLFRENR